MTCLGCKNEHFSSICTACKDYSLYEVELDHPRGLNNMQVLTQEEHRAIHGLSNIDSDNAQREFADEIKSRIPMFTLKITQQELWNLSSLVRCEINEHYHLKDECESILIDIKNKLEAL